MGFYSPPCRRGVDGETSALLLLKVLYITHSASRAVPYTGHTHLSKGWDSSVATATRYGLDGPGIESRWGQDFSHPSRPALGAHPPSYTMGTGPFPGVKRPGRGVDHPSIYSTEVKKRVELYLYSSFGPSCPILG